MLHIDVVVNVVVAIVVDVVDTVGIGVVGVAYDIVVLVCVVDI